MFQLPSQSELEAACASMPVFPLPGVVLFPHTVLQLHVFEPRYVELLQNSLAGNKLFAVPQIVNGSQDEAEEVSQVLWREFPPFLPTAGVGLVIQSVALPEDRYNIALLGVGTVKFTAELESEQGYRCMKGALLPEPQLDVKQLDRLAQIRLLFAQLLGRKSTDSEMLSALLEPDRDNNQLVNILLNMLVDGPAIKQRHLGKTSLDDTLELLESELAIALTSGFGAGQPEA